MTPKLVLGGIAGTRARTRWLCTHLGKQLIVMLTFLGFTQSAYAHGIGSLISYVIWPALPIGLIGGIFTAAVGKNRWLGLAGTLAVYPALLLLRAFSQETGYDSLTANLSMVATILLFALVFGAIPLATCYLFAEFFSRRLFHLVQQKKPP